MVELTTRWRQYVDGPDSAQIKTGTTTPCSLLVDPSLLVPDRNKITAQIPNADNRSDRAVFSILTPAYLPPAAAGSFRQQVSFDFPSPLLNNSSIYIANNNAGTPIPVVDIYLDSAGHVNWYSEAGTLSAAARDDHSTFVVAATTVYWIQFDWLGDAGGGGFKKLWINTNPALVGGVNVPNINIAALTGTPAACQIGEFRGCIDHLDGVQTTGYTMHVARGQLSDGSVIVDEVAPVSLTPPTIVGGASPTVGTAIQGVPGTFSGFPDVTFQWRSNDGTGAVDIPGATSLSYTPTNNDIAKVLTIVAIATNLFGVIPSSSAATGAVASGVPGLPASILINPVATGNPQVGLVIGSSTGTWTSTLPITAYLYQWLDSPHPIISIGLGGVPVALGKITNGASSGLDDVPDLEVVGPYVVPHDMVLRDGFFRYSGDVAVSHTRMVVYTGDNTSALDFIDVANTVTVPAHDPMRTRPFQFLGGHVLHAGDKVYIGWWGDGNINVAFDAAPGGLNNFYKIGLPFSETDPPPTPYPVVHGVGSNAYTIYLGDGAFAPDIGETTSAHLLANVELGNTIICRVTALNDAGPSDPAYTNGVGPIVLATYPVSIVAPFISAQPIVGVPLQVDPGRFFPAATTLSFQWYESLTGASDASFTAIFETNPDSLYTPTNRGTYLRVAIIATGPGGTSPPYFSNTVGPVLDAVPPKPSGVGPLPWLEFCDTEIGNAARTLSYLRRGLADTQQGHWELGDGDVCSVLYRTNGGTCSTPEVFVSPSADPAPWHDPRDRGSDSFLGFVLLDIQGYDSMLSRVITNRLSGLGGGYFGQQNRIPRVWKFRGVLVSSSGAGAEYGLRWLTHALQASCDPCDTCSLKVRLFCPPSDCSDDEAGERSSYDVALLDGPHEVEPWGPHRTASTVDTLAGCRDWVTVEFTIAAANPFLYQRPVTHLEIDISQQAVCTDICDFLFGSAGDSHCAVVEPPPRGTLGSIYTLTSLEGMGGLFIETYKTCPGLTSDPVAPVLQVELSGIPANSTVTVDAAKHTITVATTDPVTGKTTLSDGQHLVVLQPGKGLQWNEIDYCDDLHCFCIRSALPCTQGQVHVVLQTQVREG